jgi:hypothetical protein
MPLGRRDFVKCAAAALVAGPRVAQAADTFVRDDEDASRLSGPDGSTR